MTEPPETSRPHPIDIMDAVLKPVLGSLPATSAAVSCYQALRSLGYLTDAPQCDADEEMDNAR